MRATRRAFTLIELLVVIAIIAILAAILFPVFAQAKESAKQATCVSNARQNAVAWMLYAADADEHTVPATRGYPMDERGFGGVGWGRPETSWAELVQPYAKGWGVFRCPTDPNANDRGMSIGFDQEYHYPNDPDYVYWWGQNVSLGVNFMFLSPMYADYEGNDFGSEGVPLSRINQTSKMILMADAGSLRDPNSFQFRTGNWIIMAPCIYDMDGNVKAPTTKGESFYTFGGWQPPDWLGYRGDFEWGLINPRHRNRANTVFVDSHVKPLTIGDFAAGCDVQPVFTGPITDSEKYLWDLD